MESTEVNLSQPINRPPVKYSTGVLVMGILSIICFCCIFAGIAGITLGILAVVLGNKSILEYYQKPGFYSESSLKNAKAGRVCGIIGLSIGGLWLLGLIVYISIVGFVIGSLFSLLPWNMFTF